MSKEVRLGAVPHGTVSGYDYWKCKCDACRRAAADHQWATKRRRRGLTPDDLTALGIPHGDLSTYTNLVVSLF